MIAWVTNHLEKLEGEQGIPGKYRGGAEMTDARFIEGAPTEIKVFNAADWKQTLDFDKIIVTNTDALSDTAMLELAKKEPIIMVHHKQTRTQSRQTLLSSAEQLICHTPRHLEIELEWVSPKSSQWILSHHDPSTFTIGKKESFALWAARFHAQKGLNNAVEWAAKNQIPLVTFWDKPRETVLETMSRAEHFVFLPNDFDAEPRTVIEAVLSGCKVHINDNVGIGSVPNWADRDALGELVNNSVNKFWNSVT